MKNLDSFLTEKSVDKRKPHTRKKKRGKNDARYLEMMHKYKQLRKNRSNRDEANKLMKQIRELGNSGDVSPDCKLAGCYI